MSKHNFDVTDLQKWQKEGIITQQQLEVIIKQEELEIKPEIKEKKSGFNLISVLYYFGGFLALLSFVIFIGMSWDNISGLGRFLIALAAVLLIGGLGYWLRFRQKFEVAGGLLIFVATAILPLLVYTLTSLTGMWEEGASFYELRFVVLIMGLVSLIGSIAALYFTRFSLISILIAGFVHLTLIDLVQIFWGESFLFNECTAVISSGIILLGIWLTNYDMKSHAFWFKLYGLIWLQITFSILFFDSNSILFGLFFLAVYLIIAGLSLYLKEALFMVFGIISIYFYIFKLVFDIFEDTVYFPLILGFIGISIVLLAVFSQKYGGKLFRRKSEKIKNVLPTDRQS